MFEFHVYVAVWTCPAHDVGVWEVVDVASCVVTDEVWYRGMVEAHAAVSSIGSGLFGCIAFMRCAFVPAVPEFVLDFPCFGGSFVQGCGVRTPAERVPVCVVVQVAEVVVCTGGWDFVEVLGEFPWDSLLYFVPGKNVAHVLFPL